MNVNFTGRARVFKNERETRSGGTFTSYSTSISRKNLDGEWENAPLEVKFKRDGLPTFGEYQNYVAIIIDNAFLTFRRYVDANEKKHTAFYIMILDWHYEEDDLEPTEPKSDVRDLWKDDDDLDDLPF